MSIFSTVTGKRPSKNKFDLSHERKMSLRMGTLTPFYIQEVVPGDSFRVNTEMLMRLQPLASPMFHRMRTKTDYFFVPNRLVWDNWQKFITGGDKGEDNPVPPHFYINNGNKELFKKGTLADYFGIPVTKGGGQITNFAKINALPFRAYTLIYNEYFRDQNLIDEVLIFKGDGDMTGTNSLNFITQLRNRSWEKDYFTSVLPDAQKGGAVQLPIDPVINYKDVTTVTTNPAGENGTLTASVAGELGVGTASAKIENIESITDAGTTINDLRVAVRLQEWLERNARAGSRYIESILSNFGVLSSDARLQRPEYLGGGIAPIVISEVLSTFQQADDNGYPQGNMTGHGISTGNFGGFKRRFEEHGFVIGVMTVIPRTAYQQGIHKSFQRFDKFDYLWPSFAQLGEQEVKLQELYHDYLAPQPITEETFGYQSRYAEYKYMPSTVHGDFRDDLAFWHMGRIFNNKPVLNESFITADPTKRVFAVEDTTVDEILCQVYNRVDAIRPLPYYNTPTL